MFQSMKYLIFLLIGFFFGFFLKYSFIEKQTQTQQQIPIPILTLSKNQIEKIQTKIKPVKNYTIQDKLIPIEQFKLHIYKKRYKEAMEIYSNFMNSEDINQYQYFLFSYIESLISQNDKNAIVLVELFLNIEYENSYGLYFLSQIQTQNKDYKKGLKILYELKNNYLEDDLSKAVTKDIIIIEQLLRDKNELKRLSKIYNKKIKLKKYGKDFIVQAILNGSIKVNLLIDTGASISSINNSVLQKLQYKVLNNNIILNTAAGDIDAKLIQINTLTLDDIAIFDFELTVSSIELSKMFDGLLGMNFLNKFKFYIDQKNAILYLN